MRVGVFTYGMGEHLTGIGRYTRGLCTALSRLNVEIEVILINPYRVDQQDFFGLFENYHVPILQKLPQILLLGPTLIPIISNKLGLDIVHDPCGIAPFLLPRREHAPRRIVTIHDAVPYVFPHVQPPLTKLTFHTFIPWARKNVDAILTVSQHSKEDLIRYVGFQPHKVHVTYEGVQVPSEEDLKQRRLDVSVLKRWNLTEPYFLYVGALNPRKNVPSLISAFSEIVRIRSDVKLVLVGPETWWADDTLQAAKHLKHSVIVTGYVQDAQLESLYAHATALVYPSIYEGFGLPPLEAMAYGVPVITSNVSSLPEVVGEAGIMVDPTDIHALSTSMLKVLEPSVSFDLSQRGRHRAQAFQWEATARKTLAVYEGVL